MKAVAVFPAERAVRLIDVDEPTLAAPTDVKIRVLDVGICGTDREIAAFGYGTPPPGSACLVLGHECLAEVVEVGPAVTGLAPGDLAVPLVRRPCPHESCVACRAGRQDFCFTGDYRERGIKQIHGYMCEYAVDDERFLARVPAALGGVGVLVEPLSIAEKAMAQVWDIQSRLPWMCASEESASIAHCRTALVLGAGAVGLLGALLFALKGFRTWVYSREPTGGSKANLTQALGAAYISARDTPPEAISERVGEVDLVYEAVGASELAFRVIQELGPNAVFVFTGVPGRKGPVAVEIDLLMRNLVLKNQTLFGTVNADRGAFAAAIADLGEAFRRAPRAIESMVTQRVPLSASLDALAGHGVIRTVLAIGERPR
jgi:threonine dehydrogenase-like Zn-dependent dehydrogenase